MSDVASWLAEAKHLRDELVVQAHLLKMELRDEWDDLSRRLGHLEDELEKIVLAGAEEIGEAESRFYLGNQQEVEALLRGFKSIREQHNDDS